MSLTFVWLSPVDGAGWWTELVVVSLAELLPVRRTGVIVGVGCARKTAPPCCWRIGWVGVATGSLASGVAVPNDGRSMVAFSRPVLVVLGWLADACDSVFGFASLVG